MVSAWHFDCQNMGSIPIGAALLIYSRSGNIIACFSFISSADAIDNC